VCSVNPLLAREERLGFGEDLGTAPVKKRVLVVGGGPSGMEAAITASTRGHEVFLAEESDALGGLLKFSDHDSLKEDLRNFKEYLIRRVRFSSVRVLLNTYVTDEVVEYLHPDNIIIATGSTPVVPKKIKGIERARHAAQAYYAPELTRGERVVIIGGGLVGIETGLHLAAQGKKVTVLEMQNDFAPDAKMVYKIGLLRQIQEKGVELITGAQCREVTDSGVLYLKDAEKRTAPADTVFYAVGNQSRQGAYFDLYDKAPNVALVGDSKKVGQLDNAIHTGFFAAMDVGGI
jgi:pyruvate/2-oxoglutarate dehydrogenase complex dihydrolipoamide dehydrogenase (E3) component